MAKAKDTRPPLESLHFKSPIQKDDLAEDAHKKFFEAMRGPKGKDGADGKTPVPGVDFPLPRDGRDGFDGLDGTPGSKFLGTFKSSKELPSANDCHVGDFALVGDSGTIWYIV